VDSNLPKAGVDLIIADVPCTGSGTWARTPEWLKAFDLEMIAEYQNTQKSIVTNLPLHLNANGYLLYITCSVFKQENEEVVEFLETNCQMELVKQAVVHEQGGDYLFAALLKKMKG
jgi:16S rRNA (cytosine967-C5)-methyltransferase